LLNLYYLPHSHLYGKTQYHRHYALLPELIFSNRGSLANISLLSKQIGLSNQTEQRLGQKSAEMDQDIAQIRGLVEVATTDTRNVEANVDTRTKAFAEAVEQLECRIEEHDQAIDELINSEAEDCTCAANQKGNSPGEE